jgi:hypothetical protein
VGILSQIAKGGIKMKKYFSMIVLSIILYSLIVPVAFAEDITKPSIQNNIKPEDQVQSLGRGSYRSPSGSFRGGTGAGRDGYSTGPRAPSSNIGRNPRAQPGQPQGPFGRWGGLLGGIAAGALIGHLLNPFGGFGYGGGGFSLISLLIWAGVIYIGYRLFKKFSKRRY